MENKTDIFIKEFYYSGNEEFLTEALSDKNKKKFFNFVNAWGAVNAKTNLDSFMMEITYH